MKICILTIIFVFGFVQNQCDTDKTLNTNQLSVNKTVSNQTPEVIKPEHLPDGIEPQTKVRKQVKNDKGEVISSEVETVEQRLRELNAKYKGETLFDGTGREIKFFKPLCRGAAPGFEEAQEARKKKDKELSELEKNYTVIILFCDPGEVM